MKERLKGKTVFGIMLALLLMGILMLAFDVQQVAVCASHAHSAENGSIPIENVQLPRVIESEFSNSSEVNSIWFHRNGSVIIGFSFTQRKTRFYKDGFNYTEVTTIIFKGLGGGQPVSKTVTFEYPEEGDNIPANEPYPVFFPTEIVTEYRYLNPEEPNLSEYLGSTSYVTIGNLGEPGNITVMVEDWSTVFHMESGEMVKATANLVESLPYYSGPLSPTTKIEWNSYPYRWEVRRSILGDVSQGAINIEKIVRQNINIWSNGLIEGTDKIHRDGNVYTFTGNIYGFIDVERDNIVVDGAGYALSIESGGGTKSSDTVIDGAGYALKGVAVPGIDLSGRNNVTIKNMELKEFPAVTHNFVIYLYDSSNNIIAGNNITNNNCTGIGIYNSSNNTFYHNNFLNNTSHVYIGYSGYPNFWDNGVEGNYWSDYTGVDSDHDGIGDTHHVMDANNTDHYPLVSIFHSFSTPYDYQINVVSNSSISNFDFGLIDPSHAVLTFNVTGENGTQGFCRIRIPKVLINGSYVVRLNGEVITYPQVRELPCSSEIYEYLYINYTHSEQSIEIGGTTTIPEFPAWTSMLLILIMLTVAITIYKRRLLRTPNR